LITVTLVMIVELLHSAFNAQNTNNFQY